MKFGKFNIKAAIAAFYVSLVWCIYIFLNAACDKYFISGLVIVFFVCSYILAEYAFRKLEPVKIVKWNDFNKKTKAVLFAAAFFITLGIMLIWYLAYYPGSFSFDSIEQYEQVINGEYNDWHPVLHTLLFFTLPIKLTGNPASIALFQLLYFSLLMGYFALTLCELCGIKTSFFFCLLLWMNPYVCGIVLYPWKDVGFAIAGVFCLIFSIRILGHKTKNSWGNLLILGVGLAVATILRHNAILFTAPIIVALFFNMEKKSWGKIMLCFAVCFFLIKVPLYRALDVQKPDYRVTESMGLPLTIIGNVVKETPEKMDEELTEFVYSLASQEQWQNCYVTGSFNNLKYVLMNDPSSDFREIIEDKGFIGMLRLMCKCLVSAPKASLRALFALTNQVYGFEENGYTLSQFIFDNPYGIQYPVIRHDKLRYYVECYSKLMNNSGFRFLKSYGIMLLLILVCVLNQLNFRSWLSWKKALLFIPVLTYDYGTMLLLSGPGPRFFYITFLAVPLLIVYSFFIKGQTNEE